MILRVSRVFFAEIQHGMGDASCGLHRLERSIPMATEIVILGVTVSSYLLCALFLRVCDRI